MVDTKRLSEELVKKEDIKDIPAIYVLRVAVAILEIIESGECFLDSKEVEVYVDKV